MKNKRFYNFTCVIYEDDERFQEQYVNLRMNYECIYIRHDKDLFEEDAFDENMNLLHSAGDLKKPHYHFVIKCKNAKTISSIAKICNMDEHMIEPIKKSVNGALKYLIHYGYDNKYQYSVDEVESLDINLLKRFRKLIFDNASEEEQTDKIEDFLRNATKRVTLTQLGAYARNIAMWSVFRRNLGYYKAVLDEYNSRYGYYE